MEDTVNAIFNREPDQLFYKQLLDSNEASELNSQLLQTETVWKNGAVIIANGHRPYIDVNLDEDLVEIKQRLYIVLRDYFPDMIVSPDARFYNHQYGGVKPHTDGNRDGISCYTLLLYLRDDFEGGRLSIKVKRSEEEKKMYDPMMNHKVFTLEPKSGYGVIFRKSLLHWADEVVDGNKNFLLIQLFSAF